MLALFTFTVRQLLLQRKIWLTLGLLVFPAGLFGSVRLLLPQPSAMEVWEAYHGLMLHLLLTLILPLVCMLHGLSLLGSEIEQRTIVYLTTRRLHRATVLLVRFVATWLTVTLVLQAAMILTHYALAGGVDLQRALPAPAARDYAASVKVAEEWRPGDSLAMFVGVAPVGVAAYLALFMVLSLLARRPLAMSIAYIVIVELVLGSVPLPLKRYTLVHHVRQSVVHRIPDVRRMLDVPRDLLDELYPLDRTGVDNLLIVAGVLLVLGGVLVSVRELSPPRVVRD